MGRKAEIPAPPVVPDNATARGKQPDPATPIPVRDPPSRALVVQLPPALALYARTLTRWRAHCQVTVLRDGGETFPAMLAAIAAAQHSICLETYILAGDKTGDRFKVALIERARAGVAVRLIYDAVGSFGLSAAWVAELRAAGVEVIDFNPISPWRRRFRLSHRDHRKILVVDNQVAFTGGLNISDDYAAVADGGVGWHDMHCKVTGAIVFDLARMFRRSWLRAGGQRYAPIPPSGDAPKGEGTAYTRLIDNTQRRRRAAIRRAYLYVLRQARDRVLIENAYFLPDRGLRRAMTRAAHRGVDVRVIVPGRSDVRIIEWASLYVIRALAKRGVKIYRWRGPMLHAKTAVVDGTWSTIGSYNLDSMSRFNNLEVTVEILDPAIGTELVAQFEHDLAHADAFDEASWKRLPWWKKALSWVFFRLRRFL